MTAGSKDPECTWKSLTNWLTASDLLSTSIMLRIYSREVVRWESKGRSPMKLGMSTGTALNDMASKSKSSLPGVDNTANGIYILLHYTILHLTVSHSISFLESKIVILHSHTLVNDRLHLLHGSDEVLFVVIRKHVDTL
eukprot:CAMPEP_0116995902 /NCGR_PEP_ID=MMETSP0467-20121206/69076_1 /TAXON_ID=283647 /ORGANISM="Mesodinium pulex, Strain SPMC105" /LENGTH=138 /DNA_ID=CAMNT_0004694397 /DNA_START=221 /DNA_END=634 /DNA_ORIENTATION=-